MGVSDAFEEAAEAWRVWASGLLEAIYGYCCAPASAQIQRKGSSRQHRELQAEGQHHHLSVRYCSVDVVGAVAALSCVWFLQGTLVRAV